MTLREAGEQLLVHRCTVKRWLKQGLIQGKLVKPPKGVGGREYWDIDEKELGRYLKEQNK